MLAAEAAGSGAPDGAQIWTTRPAGNADQASAKLGATRGGSGTGWIELWDDARARGTRDWFAEAEGMEFEGGSEMAFREGKMFRCCWWP